MEKKKLELITLIIISLVVVVVALLYFVFDLDAISFPIESTVISLGLLTYMVFSVVSFQKFSKKITDLNDELATTQSELEERKKECTSLKEDLSLTKSELNTKNEQIVTLEEKIANLEQNDD